MPYTTSIHIDRFRLLCEEQARWDRLAQFKDTHTGTLIEEDEAELRRLHAEWTSAVHALTRLDHLGKGQDF